MLDIHVGSDLFKAGVTEDGQDFIGERWFVQAEAVNGQRWVHIARFDSTKAVDGEDCDGMVFFPDNRVEALGRAESLAANVRLFLNAGGKLTPEFWIEVDPRYGSIAYQTLDNQGYFKDLERKAEF